jgi:hypothetical protein
LNDPAPLGFEARIEVDVLEPESDIRAMAVDRVVSVTPIVTDMTALIDFDFLATWLKH